MDELVEIIKTLSSTNVVTGKRIDLAVKRLEMIEERLDQLEAKEANRDLD